VLPIATKGIVTLSRDLAVHACPVVIVVIHEMNTRFISNVVRISWKHGDKY